MKTVDAILDAINGVLWHEYVLYTVLGVGILFTIRTILVQYVALTHGITVIRGKFDRKDDPGAISHFQALSAALSATVGLGNIAGVSIAVALGGPGAVFWMWIVGFFGMALKATEVTLSMLYRNTDDPENPHGGPMWVVAQGLKDKGEGWRKFGKVVGTIFCITLLISAVTGGNMFQAWNVAEVTSTYFPFAPRPLVGLVLAVLVALVIIGGIKRIGKVAGSLVPLMCGLYLLGCLYVLALNISDVPTMLALIVKSAFAPAEAAGSFLGGTAGYAFVWGMKRALFSNEAGQGSAPIAHSAARTDEPVREGIVAGLEPFIDTLVVCTLTALVVLTSGAWNRPPAAHFAQPPGMVAVSGQPQHWAPDTTSVPAKTASEANITDQWQAGDGVFMLVRAAENPDTGLNIHKATGTVAAKERGQLWIDWDPFYSETQPSADGDGLHMRLAGSALTSHAFDRVAPGLGMWLVVLASWLFALSTMISWSYYGEQGVIFMFGEKGVLLYKIIYCALVVVSTVGFMKTDAQLDAWTALGTGVMLFANIPIMLGFGGVAMGAYHDYLGRLRRGEMQRTD